MPLLHRTLDVSFRLGEGSFGEAGTADEVKISGARVSCSITKAGGASLGAMQLRIWGMTLSKMQQLSTLGVVPSATRKNEVIVEAGDERGSGVVFAGTIQNAWVDFGAMPDVVFQVDAYVGGLLKMKPMPPTSYRGAADVATVLAGIANTMGVSFENSGVQGVLVDPYLPGTGIDQVRAVCNAAGIEWVLDNGVLAIWPKNGARGSVIPVVSPETGLEKYPTFTSKGILCSMLYTPNIGYGQMVEVRSQLKPACGKWRVFTLAYQLDSEVPGGRWHMMFEAAPPGYTPISR